MNSLSSSRNSPKRRCRRSRDGKRSCRSRPGSHPTPLASRSDGCRRRIGKRRSWYSNNMVVSQARSRLSNSTPTSSCRRAMNSFRRKRDLTRPEGETPLTEAHVSAAFDELLSTLEQKVSPAHVSLLAVDVQNDFVADSSSRPLTPSEYV